MARAGTPTALCALAVCACLALHAATAFLPAAGRRTLLRGDAAAAAAAAAAVGAATPAEAFVVNSSGKEYFDPTLGYSPLTLGVTMFAIVAYGQSVIAAVRKYQPDIVGEGKKMKPVLDAKANGYTINALQKEAEAKGELPYDRKRVYEITAQDRARAAQLAKARAAA